MIRHYTLISFIPYSDFVMQGNVTCENTSESCRVGGGGGVGGKRERELIMWCTLTLSTLPSKKLIFLL